jgi:ABC-type glycerol-3-phosphate transport system permease component
MADMTMNPPSNIERTAKWTSERILINVVLYGTLTLFAIVALVPFFWMISSSLMTLGETLNKQWLPSTPQLENYPEAWRQADFASYFGNSIAIAAVTIVGLLFVTILSSYAFAKIKFWGRDLIFTLLLLTLMVPEAVLMIPNYLIIAGQIFPLPEITADWPNVATSMSGSWLNNLPALTVPFFGSAFAIFLMRQFFMQIPDELWEAARIDGCGHMRFLVQVVIPLSRPVILTVVLLTFIDSWNALLWPLIVTTDSWRPIMLGLYNFSSEGGNQTHLQMAAAFITIIPMLTLYFFTQKTFTEGIATTGLKG